MLKGFAKPAPTTQIKVAVALRTATPREACLNRLRKSGLIIDRIVGNILIGSVLERDRKAIRSDPDVLEVEESAKLSMS